VIISKENNIGKILEHNPPYLTSVLI